MKREEHIYYKNIIIMITYYCYQLICYYCYRFNLTLLPSTVTYLFKLATI